MTQIANREMAPIAPAQDWIRANLYMQMTGHTKNTLYTLRKKLFSGKHYKIVNNVTYYNWRAIDKWISRQ